MSPVKRVVRCAVYTRKSSEEGLEQSFNSLHAQREACSAYIASQRHEGWRILENEYDDGGYSGATMERPAVRRLLEDIKAGKIDVVVVYKVDRLTRSLADFAKTIEIFDAQHVSFVSVTQQFNTTSSMGRLTLNVLLSFAQFEREVAGERIRDKIAASKRKGMWMGGTVPLGYDASDRRLVINPGEAKTVRRIYRAYLKLGCVARLKTYLERAGIKSKSRVSKAGRKSGGTPFSRGALYELLQNRVYLGEIRHRGQFYPGQHPGIVPAELWNEVQARLRINNDARRSGISAKNPSLLVGLLYDEQGNVYTPTHAVKDGKRYRYYVSQAVIHHRPDAPNGPSRIPAQEIERLVLSKLQTFLTSSRALMESLVLDDDKPAVTQHLLNVGKQVAIMLSGATSQVRQFLRDVHLKVIVRELDVELEMGKRDVRAALLDGNRRAEQNADKDNLCEERFKLTIDARVKRCGGEMKLIFPADDDTNRARPVPSMIKAVARAHDWYQQIVEGKSNGGRSIAKLAQLDERYVSLIIQCAFLAPDIVEKILDGRQPPELMLKRVTSRLPLNWSEQRARLGMTR